LDINEGDRALLEKYFSKEPKQRVNLADMIINKIQGNDEHPEQDGDLTPSGLDPKIISVYSQ
jgi:hypothetical protein